VPTYPGAGNRAHCARNHEHRVAMTLDPVLRQRLLNNEPIEIGA
jgi:hypothetical protein